jgi:hypothetical protein
MMPAFLSRLRLFFANFTRASWKFFTGVVVAVIAFAANFTDFKQPEVRVEITSVATTSADPIDIMRVPELAALREIIGNDPFSTVRRNAALSIDEIERQMVILSNQASVRAANLDRLERQLNSLVSTPATDQETVLIELVKEIDSLPFTPSEDDSTTDRKKPLTVQERIDALVKKGRKMVDTAKKKLASHTTKVKEAEQQWITYKDTVLPNKARLVVTCAIGNKGAGATSLKPQGLLRANLGDGNYLDLLMKLSGYETSSDLAALQAQSFKIVRFQSEEVQSMNPADRQRFKTFLGNVSPATIFVADVRGHTYQSNSVPFSPGVYEQKVYDSLKQYATRTVSR